MSSALLGALSTVPRWFNPRGPISLEAVAVSFDRMLLGGLGVASPQSPVVLSEALGKKSGQAATRAAVGG